MSAIEWTGRTWNPLAGCTEESEGCMNCYARGMAWRLMHNPNAAVSAKYKDTVRKTAGGKLQWTGKINLNSAALSIPYTTNEPTVFFVNSMSDLFHPNVPFSFIDLVFTQMAICEHHTFQILTKHPDNMLKWFNAEHGDWEHPGMRQTSECLRYYAYQWKTKFGEKENWKFPLPNVWPGVSIENQKAADKRIPMLLQVPAAVRFLSCEPLLGAVDLIPVLNYPIPGTKDYKPPIDWVIAGGESGHKARPAHPDWFRTLRDQCRNMEISFFFKQWGEYYPNSLTDGSKPSVYVDSKTLMARVGKKISGRLLDGIEHNEYPVKTIH